MERGLKPTKSEHISACILPQIRQPKKEKRGRRARWEFRFFLGLRARISFFFFLPLPPLISVCYDNDSAIRPSIRFYMVAFKINGLKPTFVFPIIKIQAVLVIVNKIFLDFIRIRTFFSLRHNMFLSMLLQHPLPAQPLLIRVAMACLCNHRGTEVFHDGHARDCRAGHDDKGKDALSQMVLPYIKHPYQLLLFPYHTRCGRRRQETAKEKVDFFAKSFLKNRDFRG